MSYGVMVGEEDLFERDSDQYEILMELRENMETMDSEEFEDKFESLDAEFQSALSDDIRDFADNAIGDEHWDSDEW